MQNDKNYVVYHLHSDLSNGVTNIDSVTKYKEYIEYAKSLDMKAMAFAEHGSIFEWVHKKLELEKVGMKYIHAEEFYITANIETKVRDNFHCVLIAKNYEGFKELNILSSKAFNRNDGHFFYVPRITLDELLNTTDNIIITTACLGGILNKGNEEIKIKYLKFLIENKHRCFLEIQHHNVIDQIKYNQLLNKISKKYDIPLIAGTDTHALNDVHIKGRSILQKSKGIFFDNEDGWDLTFKTYDELLKAYEVQNSIPYGDYISAIENTNHMADMIGSWELDYSHKYPKLYNDSLQVFKEKIYQGIIDRGINKYPNFEEYKKRISHELKTYIHNGAIDYMLLEEDYKREMRKQGVPYGYSRGSVSGSVIAYILGITEVDSIKYNLNFERFMAKERVSLADCDTDWFKEDRWKVREYLFQKEGLYCCDIITFNTIALKGAIKDVGRALDMSIELTQEISDAVYLENGKWLIDDKYKEQYPELFEYADIVMGTIVSVGNHPAGLVVSPFDVVSAFGTFYSSTNDNPISQINMKEIDCQNYVKLDVLGLDCVGLIDRTCRLANIPMLTPDNMNFNDMNIWNDLSKDCTLIFQFESQFAESYLKDILREETINKIKEVNKNFSYIDLMSMANGAIRPAGESYRKEMSQGIYRDNGHKALNDFLAPTLGQLVYQEQIIEFLHSFCGFSMGEADIVRRGFSKKLGTEKFIPKIKSGFEQTMLEKYNVDNKESEVLIENFLQVIKDASSYLFSKNHSDPYSFLGFACAYLRYYYPLEFLTTALNIYKEDAEKSIKIIEYCRTKNIEIKPIKFGKSLSEYAIDKENNSIYKGIASIKFCNSKIADELMELSKNKYNSFIELLIDISTKTSVDSRQLKILTGLNFFSDFGKNKYLLDCIKIYDQFHKNKKPSKQINKKKLDELGLTEYMMKKYSGKETDSLYKDLDLDGIMNELISKLENKPTSVIEQVEFEMEYLEYVIYTNPNVSDKFYIVIGFKTYKDKTKPYLILRNIKTGDEIKTKIKKGKLFAEYPFKKFSVIKLNSRSLEKQFKSKLINGQWQKSDETEEVLVDYQIIK